MHCISMNYHLFVIVGLKNDLFSLLNLQTQTLLLTPLTAKYATSYEMYNQFDYTFWPEVPSLILFQNYIYTSRRSHPNNIQHIHATSLHFYACLYQKTFIISKKDHVHRISAVIHTFTIQLLSNVYFSKYLHYFISCHGSFFKCLRVTSLQSYSFTYTCCTYAIYMYLLKLLHVQFL